MAGGGRRRSAGFARCASLAAPYPAAMIEITASYEGDLRCQAKHGPSGQTLFTDAPVDNHGKGESFSPTDLVATALATCTMTIMGILAKRDGIDLRGMQVRVEKHMISEPVRRIGRLPVTIVVPGKLTAEQKKKLEAGAKACPVHKSLHPDIDAPLTFEYPNG
jgi:putative redox protein